MVFMTTEAFKVEVLGSGETARALAFYADYGAADVDFIKSGMQTGAITVVMAVAGGADIGGFYLNREPKYALYRRLGLPELQDLRVAETHRRRGVGAALVAEAEAMAAVAHKGLGLSVGLHAGFGAAQRLYARLGYIPDGQGVTYDRKVVEPGEKRPVDGDLALMLLKFF